VIFGAVGDDTRLEYTVIGEPVNLAAKLDKHNKKSGTRALATQDAFAMALGLSPKGPAPDAMRLPDRWHRRACRSCRARVILGDKGLADTVTDI
jgi:class 3 adenylate cyclase